MLEDEARTRSPGLPDRHVCVDGPALVSTLATDAATACDGVAFAGTRRADPELPRTRPC